MSQLEHDGLYKLQVDDDVARVTLNRPESMNSINATQETSLANGLVPETESWLSCMSSDECKERTRGFVREEGKA